MGYTVHNKIKSELVLLFIFRFVGKFKRRELWSSVQKHVTRFHFKDELANDSYIHGDKIRELKSKYKEIMKNRSIPMIKQWLEGEKKKMKLDANTVNGIISHMICKYIFKFMFYSKTFKIFNSRKRGIGKEYRTTFLRWKRTVIRRTQRTY